MFRGFTGMVSFDEMLFLTHLREDEVSMAMWKVWFGCVVLALLVWGMAGFWLAAAFLLLMLAGTTGLVIWGLNRRAKNAYRDWAWRVN